jgi:hypothetical protein
MCNKNVKIINIDENIINYNKILKINISGIYGWNTTIYEYEIKNIENTYYLFVTISGIINRAIYEKKLSDDQIINIYNFINEHEIEKEIKKRTDWYGSNDFHGSIIVSINNKLYENSIHSTQEFDNNLYKILNYLNDFIQDDYYLMQYTGSLSNMF